mmetsp:Transcript_9958/g.37593  ORF Transcript_9958/g.37593 Transcript_9958/m.37593 type:complete len:234 (-) Transcript_9958:2128-2829(-)
MIPHSAEDTLRRLLLLMLADAISREAGPLPVSLCPRPRLRLHLRLRLCHQLDVLVLGLVLRHVRRLLPRFPFLFLQHSLHVLLQRLLPHLRLPGLLLQPRPKSNVPCLYARPVELEIRLRLRLRRSGSPPADAVQLHCPAASNRFESRKASGTSLAPSTSRSLWLIHTCSACASPHGPLDPRQPQHHHRNHLQRHPRLAQVVAQLLVALNLLFPRRLTPSRNLLPSQSPPLRL